MMPNTDLKMNALLKKVKQVRTEKKVSCKFMAGKLNLSTSAYRKIEMNYTKLSVTRLFQIAEILNIPLWYLFDE